MKAQELKKLKIKPQIVNDNLPFYCVVCREFHFGPLGFSFVVGGWYCSKIRIGNTDEHGIDNRREQA